MRKTNRLWKVGAVVLGLLLVLSACSGTTKSTGQTAGAETPQSSSPEASPEAAKTLDPVELTWYYPQPAIPADLKTVEEAVNKIVKAKINATIKLNPQGFGDYDQKMNTVLASGEQADIIWTSSWLFQYPVNQGKGAFIALDELIDEYAPTLKSSMPAFVLDATRIGGKIYAVPNYQTVTNKEGFIIQKRFVDKYKLDVSSIKKFEDIDPFLDQIRQGDPDVVPLGVAQGGYLGYMQKTMGFELINGIVGIQLDDPYKVIDIFDSPIYQRYTDLMRQLYTKGYINREAATLKNQPDLEKTGKIAVQSHNTLKPGIEAEIKSANGGHEVITIPIAEPYAQTASIISTMQAIGKNSKNPERAMMFINLLNTDQELYNIICYGIEGVHYSKNADGSVKVNKEAGYAPDTNWVFGNVFNAYLVEGQDPSIVAATKQENETAVGSPIMGFIFQPAPVAAEIANITTVMDQYRPGLDTGTVDPREKLGDFIDKLKSAGIDTVVAEAQKQLDAWKSLK